MTGQSAALTVEELDRYYPYALLMGLTALLDAIVKERGDQRLKALRRVIQIYFGTPLHAADDNPKATARMGSRVLRKLTCEGKRVFAPAPQNPELLQVKHPDRRALTGAFLIALSQCHNQEPADAGEWLRFLSEHPRRRKDTLGAGLRSFRLADTFAVVDVEPRKAAH